MFFKTFREAQVMCYLLSYVLDCPAYLHHCDGENLLPWVVSSNSHRLDHSEEPELEVFRIFSAMRHEGSRKPVWWSDEVLEEVQVLQASFEAQKNERLEAEIQMEDREAEHWKKQWEDPAFQEDWRNAEAAGGQWHGDHWEFNSFDD